MRVIFVSALPVERSSTVGRVLPLARATAAAGHEVILLTLSGRTEPPYAEEAKDAGVHIRAVGPAVRATSIRRPGIADTIRRHRSGRTALFDALARESPDVLILAKPHFQNTGPALLAAAARQIPLVLDVDDRETHASRLPVLARWYAEELETRAARAAALITAASPALVEHVRLHAPATRIELLPTGISVPADVPRARLREKLRLPIDEPMVLYIGSLAISSGHRVDLLIDAFAQLTRVGARAHLVLAGDGIDEQRLRNRAARSPVASQIHFLGHFTPPFDLALARDADLLVDPVDRTRTSEAKSSHRIMLALATGTPVVAGNVGIRRVLLPRDLHADCLYDPSEDGALAQELAHGLDPTFRTRFREKTTGLINRWTWDTLGATFVTLLSSLPARAR